MSGYWGVVVTDFIQFIIAIAGSIVLAVVSFSKLGGFSGIQEKILTSQQEMGQGTFSFFPPMSLELESPFISMLIFLFVMWWANHYADGGGYIIQRIASCKDEKNSQPAQLQLGSHNELLG